MPSFKNRLGDKYGRLTVVGYSGKDKRGKHLWDCECSCGNKKIVVSDNLSSGKSKSCGCLLDEFLKRRGNQYGLLEDREDAILRVQYSHLKRRHRLKKFNSNIITFDEFKYLSNSKCTYCGLSYSRVIEDRLNETKSMKLLSGVSIRVNGIDRIDSNIGYTKENSVSCCKFCNTAKSTMSRDEFLKWIKKVYEYNF